MTKGRKAKYIIVSFVLIFAAIFSYAPFTAQAADEWVYIGDYDGNGLISASDARSVLRIAAMIEPKPEAGSKGFRTADADKDGKINSVDARLILRNAAKLEFIAQELNPAIKIGNNAQIINTMRTVANKERQAKERGFAWTEQGKVLSAKVTIPASLKAALDLIESGSADRMIREMQDDLLAKGTHSDSRDFTKSSPLEFDIIYNHYYPIKYKNYSIGSDLKESALKTIKADVRPDGSILATLAFNNETVKDIHKNSTFNVQHSRVFGDQDYAMIKNEFSGAEGMTLKDLSVTYKDSYVTYEISPSGRLISAHYYQKWETSISITIVLLLIPYTITMKVTSEISQTYTF